MRRLGALLTAVLVLATTACGDGGGRATDGGLPVPDPAAGPLAPGLIVGQQSVDGRLTDVVVGVDPATGETTEVPVAAIGLASGVAAGPGRALYTSGDTNVLVDLTAGSVEDLGLPSQEYLPTLARLTGGVGQRYAVLAALSGDGVALVDLTSGEVTDLTESLGGGPVLAAGLRPDESVALVGGQEASYTLPTDDPTAVERIGDGYGQFLGDGGSAVISGPAGTSVRDLATGRIRVLTEGESGALPVGDLVVLQTSPTAATLVDPATGDTLDTLVLAPQTASPVTAADALLVSIDRDQDWQLIDGVTGTITSLPRLAGFTEQPAPTPATRWLVFRPTRPRESGVVGVDTGDGGVQPLGPLPEGERFTSIAAMAPDGPWMVAATDSTGPDGTAVTRGRLVNLDTGVVVDLGPRFQGATFSPDGEQVAWSSGTAAELQVAPVEDIGAAELVATGIVVPIWLRA